MGEPITPGLGAPIVEALSARTGLPTRVEMRDGTNYRVLNVCWGRDMGEDWDHVYANISPKLEGESFDFFHTNEVARLVDPGTNEVLMDCGLSNT
jgi:hypothetical protein